MTTLILGSGKSAIAAQNYLLSQNERTYIYDDISRKNSFLDIENLDIKQVVISPGFPPLHPIVLSLQKKNVPVISEMELGLKGLDAPAIGITGTNGKTTVSLLIEHVLNSYQIKAKAVGNIGIPLCEYLLNASKEEVLIIEMSSYQLERVYTKSLDYGLILNIHPHHLNRYADFKDYGLAKCNLLKIVKKRTYISSQVLQIFPDLANTCTVIEEMRQKNREIFQENLESAFSICKLFHICERRFLDALDTFKKPNHRLEWVDHFLGIDFYNDSKATNVNAVIRAVENFDRDIVLIAGGYDCGGDFSLWKEALSPKVRKLVVFGESSEKMKNQLENHLDIEIAKNLDEAVDKGVTKARAGEIVLFSPGCPSFGDYKNYEQRGDAFKRSIKALKERKL